MTRSSLPAAIASPALALMLALLCGNASSAETVYRCGSAYSQTPCATGKAIDVDDARSTADRAEARRVALNEQALGERMERQRLVAEARQRPAGATNLGPTPARVAVVKQVPKKRGVHRGSRSDEIVAIDPTTLPRRR